MYLGVTRPDFPMKDAAYTPHGDDVIFLAKELVNSDHLSQQPMVVFPKGFLSRLNNPLVPMERHPIADRARKECPVIEKNNKRTLFVSKVYPRSSCIYLLSNSYHVYYFPKLLT